MADNLKEQQRAELHKAIWNIANALRGSVDGWDFKQYVLGTLFYRYISENFANYIRVMSHFTKYSVNNTILIALQTGGTATKVAGYEAWQKNFGRQVNRGEKAIKIFAPMTYKRKKEQDVIDQATGQPVRNPDGSIKKEEVEVTIPSFRVASVFDISQTSGPPLPTLVEDLEGNVERYMAFALSQSSFEAMSIVSLMSNHLSLFSCRVINRRTIYHKYAQMGERRNQLMLSTC